MSNIVFILKLDNKDVAKKDAPISLIYLFSLHLEISMQSKFRYDFKYGKN